MSIRKTNRPKALYIHIPFCNSICDYCDFTKLQYFTIFSKPYLEALKNEIKSYNIKDLDTIYIGGGTPTSLSDEEFEDLLQFLFPYAKSIKEYTIECNPESLTQNKIKLMKKYGVNRLSIGVESTNDEILISINRKHTFNDVKRAIALARKENFNNISVDLILGLPNVTKKLLEKDIENIIDLHIDHVSCYSLTVHPNTVFYINGIEPLPSDKERELYDLDNEKLVNSGFIKYEISSWSKGEESLHNLTYWCNQEYYGCGLGASGYVNGVRYKNVSNIQKYLNKIYIEEKEEVSVKDDIEYEIMLNLRTRYGLNLDKFKEKFRFDLRKRKKEEINNLIKQGLIVIENDKLIATYEGQMILDQIILKLI